MDFKELEKLAKLCHKYSIKSIDTPELKLEIDLNKQEDKAPVAIDNKPIESPQEYTEDDLINWSSTSI